MWVVGLQKKEGIIFQDYVFITFPLTLPLAYLFKRCGLFFLATEDEPTMHNSWLSPQRSEAAGWPPGLLLILCLIMRAHRESVLSLSISNPPGHHAITHFYGDLFLLCESCSCLWQAWRGVCGWKTAVNCIDKKPRATIWAAGAQYEGWLIEWETLESCRQKAINTQLYFFAIQTVEWMKSLAADWTWIIAFSFTRLSRVHTSAWARSLVFGFHAGGHYLLSWLDHRALHQSAESMRQRRK